VSGAALGTAAAGAVVLLLAIAGARQATIPAWERRAFLIVNHAPGWLFVPLWPVMQLGNLAVGCLAGLVVAWRAGEVAVAIGVVLATGLKLVTERIIRRELAGKIPARQRPGTSQPGAILRGGDVPSSGASFPSGHVVLVAAITCVLAPVLPAGWELLPGLLTILVAVGRVFVGAHNPLDVVAGAGAGLMVGGLVAALIP
jgi:undecaprenyl-diphosphatase